MEAHIAVLDYSSGSVDIITMNFNNKDIVTSEDIEHVLEEDYNLDEIYYMYQDYLSVNFRTKEID